MRPRINLSALIQRLLTSEQGATAVIFAIMMPVIIGGLALGAETGYWFMIKNTLQNAADVSAHSVGVRMRQGDQLADLRQAATRIAVSSGFHPDLGELQVNIPPLTGDYRGSREHAEVVLTERYERLFSAIFSKTPVEISTRAVVTIKGGTPLCVLALSGDGRNAFQVAPLVDVTLEGCGAASNSSSNSSISSVLYSGRLFAKCVQTSGGFYMINVLGFTACGANLTAAAPVSDPYRNFDEIDSTNLPCSNPPSSKQNGEAERSTGRIVIDGTPVMRFCADVEIKGRYNFAPGIYVIDGGNFRIAPGATVTGEEVSFFIRRGGAVNISAAIVILSAPTSGPHRGVLFSNNRNDNEVAHRISLMNGSVLSGVIYLPTSSLTFSGGRNSHCLQIVASTIQFTGSTWANANCANGSRSLMAGQTVALVE
ncbi:TadE/TadG family type IV pilus assembly protein [Mesorhizobium sp. SP-1A]|uniref:TadE/TadG family type IV pilus assembly protein n=1 Tax=Mesorhizobium sp. SP-1A TaxID=3077840 RepID=UPI0028F737BD|nr:TadE/TadG family type IV pilus assembly protein [Mesorhizobium sp. SP-1A]